jgi:diaminopimelate decarboxylase
MLSRQIASKLRGYETPFYLYDMALLRQTLESVVYESKKYGYKVHYAISSTIVNPNRLPFMPLV